MNIAIIPSWFPTKNNPLNGSFFYEQAIEIAKMGHKVYILNCSYLGRKDYFSKSNFFIVKKIINNLTIYSYTFPSFGVFRKKMPKYRVFYSRLNVLFKLIKKYKIDVLHSHSFEPAGYCTSKLAKKYNIPHVMTEHASSILTGKLNQIQIRLLRSTITHTNKIISVGNKLKNQILSYNGKPINIEVIPNFVSNIFSYKNIVFSNKFIFCTIGNLNKGKNHDTLIKAFSYAFKGNTSIVLKIIGEGPEEKNLKKLIKDLGLINNVFLLGRRSRDDTAILLKEAHSFILVSRFETFGIAYIEALSTGRPIIGLINGGAENLITKENGILISINDIKLIAEAMKSLYRNYKKFDLNRISLDALSLYSSKKVIPRIIAIYQSLLLSSINN